MQTLLQKVTEDGIKNLVIQWVPAHCGIEGNEKADRLAEEATHLPQDNVEVDFQTAKALVKRKCKRRWIDEAKPHFAKAKEVRVPSEDGLTRREKTFLARSELEDIHQSLAGTSTSSQEAKRRSYRLNVKDVERMRLWNTTSLAAPS